MTTEHSFLAVLRVLTDLSRVTATVVLCALAACDTQKPADGGGPKTAEPPKVESARREFGPTNLAELNRVGTYEYSDRAGKHWIDEDPIVNATPFGKRRAALLSKQSKHVLPGLAWRRVSAAEFYTIARSLDGRKEHQATRYGLLEHAAVMGNTDAQATLSRCYHQGLGVAKDPKKALAWAVQAANAGNKYGAFFAAQQYREGVGTPKDPAKARRYLVFAAQRGHPKAQAILGYALTGIDSKWANWGFRENFKEARKWLLKAASVPLETAELGTEDNLAEAKALALSYLANMHALGEGGVPKNEVESLAHLYLSRSVKELDDDKKYVGHNIKFLEGQMSHSARLYAQMRAQELRPLYFEATPIPAQPATPEPKIGYGTGVFVTRQGHLLTAAHVVERARTVKALIGEIEMDAEIIALDRPNDVALLKVNADVTAAPIRSSSDVKLGDDVFTVGFPNTQLQGTKPKFTEGAISSTAGIQDDPRQFQVSVEVQPGNSGGALFDQNGNIVGLVVARLNDAAAAQTSGATAQNVNYAVKINYAIPLLAALRTELLEEQKGSWFGRDREGVIAQAKKASVHLVSEMQP